jgi:penicillin-binding protein 2
MKLKRKKGKIFGDFHESIDGKDWAIEEGTKSIDTVEDSKEAELLEVSGQRKIKRSSYLVVICLTSVIFLTLLGRLGYLQLSRGSYYLSLAEGNRIRTRVSHASRGIIYDRQKNLLATNVPNFEIKVTPKDLPSDKQERQKEINNIASLLGEDPVNIEKILVEKGENQLEPILIKENLDREQALFLELKIKDLPGISLEKNPSRQYPAGDSFSHILGYTGRIDKAVLDKNKNYSLDDYIGKSGIELFYEKDLKGENGKQQLEVDAAGKVIKEIASSDPKAGNSLVLSIDSNLQKEVNAALSEGLQKAHVEKGAIVVMNPQTGEILSLVSIPNFNNNLFATGIKPDQYEALITDERQPLFNRVVSGTYSNGSTMKPVVAAGALQEGVINENSSITCHGAIDVPNQYNPSVIYSFPCWLKSGHGSLNVREAIAESCDVFFYSVSGGNGDIQGLGAEKVAHYMHLFGLGEKTGIDLPDENEGLVPTPGWKEAAKGESWYQGDTYHMAIGQGDVLTTPLQVLNYTSCFANGGTLYQPQLVRQVINSDGKIVRDFQPIVKRQNFIKNEDINIVREGMRQTVTSGTAKALSSLPFSSAGKTGTAEVVAGGEMQAWFTCFAPYDNPQIAITVLLEKGGEGSDFAVPVAKRILEYFFRTK